jgi:tRNA modification GTPase
MTDTVVAVLTPPGRAALVTLGLSGPSAWELARAVFRTRASRELPETPEEGRFWLGRLGGDDVVLAVRSGDRIEVHGHGGREVTRLLLDEFVSRGARACGWEEFVARGEPDAIRAAALVALPRTTTTRTAAIVLDQLSGALRSAVDAIDLSLAQGQQDAASAALETLLRHAPLGFHMTSPWRVVVAGAPNVGKSSLVNALAGYQRCIVAPTPGTTRDVVTAALAIDGWPVEVSDTAGLREASEALEGQGIQQAHAAAADADLCLWVLDAAAEPVWPPEGLTNVRLVVNKIDLPPTWELGRSAGAVRVSAVTGEGIAELCAAIGRWLVPEPPAPGSAVPFTEEQVAALHEALGLVRAGRCAEARERLCR